MKRTILSALTVLVASTAVAPIAAAESANFNIQAQRLEALDRRTKTTVEHKIQVEYLNYQTKAVEAIQAARLEALDARTKAVDEIQSARLNALDARTKPLAR